ncbi:MAG TPA: hypothetical protein DD381_05445 [Lentisphaeria bacterium]|nr:MAG: hypothetical protein A2X47_07015 [Lentisphaerae bacterium GWF2_38_69]HBM15775.1 hypothetical protein [Lentisphaeria bacterium]
MRSKSYLDQVQWIVQEGKRIDNFIVPASTIIESINLVKSLRKRLDTQKDSKCQTCLDMEGRLAELDQQLAHFYEQPKLYYHEEAPL